MNRKRFYVLATICVACILIILMEYFYALWAQKHTVNSTAAIHPKQLLDEMPVIDLRLQPESSYADLVTRPLFIKGRRPVNEALSETLLTSQTATNTFDWQLNGIYTTPKGLCALLSRSTAKRPKDAHRKLTVGAELEGWTLTEIQKDRVLLEQNNQSKELLLQKSKPKELSKNLSIPLANPIPDIPPPPEALNPFNTPDSPPPAAGGFENINNDNP
ncbi:MAG: hypothetical protein RIQ94_330 [Pseudomonadota bacterium]